MSSPSLPLGPTANPSPSPDCIRAGEAIRQGSPHFTILTTIANAEKRAVHDRMPVTLERLDWPVWLGEEEGNSIGLCSRRRAESWLWPV